MCSFFLARLSPAQTPGFIISGSFIIGRIPRILHYIRLLSMLPCHMPCYLPFKRPDTLLSRTQLLSLTGRRDT